MKNKSLLYIVIILALSIFISIQKKNEENDILNEGVRDTAVVKSFTSVKNRKYFEYQYEVDGNLFHGNERTLGTFKNIKIGDSVIIVHKSSAPEKSMPTNVIDHRKNHDFSRSDIEESLGIKKTQAHQ